MEFSKKGKTNLFSGLLVLALLVFLAGFLTIRMLDFSLGIDPLVPMETSTTDRNLPLATDPLIIRKKIPPLPSPPQEPEVSEAPESFRMPIGEESEKQESPPEHRPTLNEIGSLPPKSDPVLSESGGTEPSAPDVSPSLPPALSPAASSDRIDRVAVQAGAFRVKRFADERLKILKDFGFDPYMLELTDEKGSRWYTVRIGRDETLTGAKETLLRLREKSDLPAAVMYEDSLVPFSAKKQQSKTTTR